MTDSDSLIGQYRALEWALIPLPEGSKVPVAKHWGTRQFDPADFSNRLQCRADLRPSIA
jgi:hypothetical protein